jgi:hypothetical protein
VSHLHDAIRSLRGRLEANGQGQGQ